MATQLFSEALTNARDPVKATDNARMWLREQSQTVRTVSDPKKIINKQPDRLVTNITVGRMYLFMYNPKMKDELPYYDRFPLIFPFRRVQGGFYGINMHYLPHMLRARLMDNLYALANNDKYDDTTKLRLSYSLLHRTSKLRFFEPCVKRYLNSHVQTRFLWVPADQWETALFLPLERFVGATKQQVWQDSRRKIRI
jgi:hypothetical protein